MSDGIDLVIGVGEVGGPLADLLEAKRTVVRLDVGSGSVADGVDVMHVCFSFGDSFSDAVTEYITEHNPRLTVIHSTVVPGTTRNVARTGRNVVYSPVRGRH